MCSRNGLKSTTKPLPAPAGLPLGSGLRLRTTMGKLLEFYRKYRQYILSDGLMYVVFMLALALMFVFFR